MIPVGDVKRLGVGVGAGVGGGDGAGGSPYRPAIEADLRRSTH